jgi:hypothetical protein
MELADYFNSDDGSLPEIEVCFGSGEDVVAGRKHLFAHGARDVSVGGTSLWIKDSGERRPFEDPDDAELVVAGVAESFHIVLADIACAGSTLPDVGVFVSRDELVLDYRMGPEWGSIEIDALLKLLHGLRKIGGRVSATAWWGNEIASLLADGLDRMNRT